LMWWAEVHSPAAYEGKRKAHFKSNSEWKSWFLHCIIRIFS
jgi:hypothetical protein